MTNEEAMRLLENMPITFSKDCRSGRLFRCECWRCRGERGEAVTEESQRLAAKLAAAIDQIPMATGGTHGP